MPELSPDSISSADLSQDATALFKEGQSTDAFLKKLGAARLFQDAIRYRAHMLAVPEGAAWSLSCLRELATNLGEQEQAALNSVEGWLAEPTDAHRRICKSAAQQTGLTTAAGCLAMAVFFAEGSIAPAERDSVPPPPGAARKLLESAITLAVVQDPQQAATRYEKCLALASRFEAHK